MHDQGVPLSTALISTDPEFHEVLQAALDESGLQAPIGVRIQSSFREVPAERVQELREAGPTLVVVDLEEEAETGIKLAQFLADKNPALRFIATGPELAPKLLMEAMRAGISEYLPKPVEQAELVAALQRLRRKLGAGANGRPPDGRLLAVIGAKGGSGTTTIATNLAVHLAKLTDGKTLLVDLDLALGETAVFLGVQPRFDFVDFVKNLHRMDADLLDSYIEKHATGLHLLSAPFNPEKSDSVKADDILKVLQFLKRHYDYLVIDASKAFSPAALAAFQKVERIFLVTTADLPSLRNVKRSMPLLGRLTGGEADRLRLLVNRHQSTDLITLEEVERTLDMEVAHTLANDFSAVSESINSGRPAVLDDSSRFSQDIRSLANDIAGVVPSMNGKAGRFGSILKLFRRKQEA